MVAKALEHDRLGELKSAWFQWSSIPFFVLFIAAVAGICRNEEADRVDASLAVLASGAVAAAMYLAADAALVGAVYAADHHAGAGPIRAIYSLHTPFLVAVALPLASLLGTVAFVVIPTRALPRWLGEAAAVIAVLCLLDGAYIFGDETSRGAFGGLWALAVLALFPLWVLATVIVLLLRTRKAALVPAPS